MTTERSENIRKYRQKKRMIGILEGRQKPLPIKLRKDLQMCLIIETLYKNFATVLNDYLDDAVDEGLSHLTNDRTYRLLAAEALYSGLDMEQVLESKLEKSLKTNPLYKQYLEDEQAEIWISLCLHVGRQASKKDIAKLEEIGINDN